MTDAARAAASPAADSEHLVFLERVQALYRPRIESVASGLVVGAVLAVALLRTQPVWLVLLWYAGICVVQSGRGALLKLSRLGPAHIDDPARWARRYTQDVALAGLYWGVSLALMARADDVLTLSFMAWALGGMAVGSITVHAYHPPVMFTFLIGLLLPFIARLVVMGEFTHRYLALGLMLLGVYLAVYGRYHARTLSRSIALRHENRQLIAQLERERATAVQLQATAEAASLSKSRFFAGASHDLRQPLQALSLYAAVLSDSDLPGELHEVSVRVGASVQALEDLFEGVLDIARIEAGGMDIQRLPVEVQALMDRALLLFSGEALDKGLSIKCVPCSQWVLGDRLALQRIVSNLVANAVRHTQTGRVLIGARRRGTRLRLVVLDTGPGIAESARERIFEEFYRLPSTTGQGFGLGLATVKRLSDAAGYRLGFDSAPGRGSAFWVELPRVAAPAPEFHPTQPAVLTAPGGERSLTILLVEDDPAARDALQTTLRSWGHFCLSADTLPAALAMLEGQPLGWDAVISDFDLPGGSDGLQLIATVRAASRADLPGVLISGTMNPALRAAAEAANCLALPKPVRPLQLRAVLTRIGTG